MTTTRADHSSILRLLLESKTADLSIKILHPWQGINATHYAIKVIGVEKLSPTHLVELSKAILDGRDSFQDIPFRVGVGRIPGGETLAQLSRMVHTKQLQPGNLRRLAQAVLSHGSTEQVLEMKLPSAVEKKAEAKAESKSADADLFQDITYVQCKRIFTEAIARDQLSLEVCAELLNDLCELRDNIQKAQALLEIVEIPLEPDYAAQQGSRAAGFCAHMALNAPAKMSVSVERETLLAAVGYGKYLDYTGSDLNSISTLIASIEKKAEELLEKLVSDYNKNSQLTVRYCQSVLSKLLNQYELQSLFSGQLTSFWKSVADFENQVMSDLQAAATKLENALEKSVATALETIDEESEDQEELDHRPAPLRVTSDSPSVASTTPGSTTAGAGNGTGISAAQLATIFGQRRPAVGLSSPADPVKDKLGVIWSPPGAR